MSGTWTVTGSLGDARFFHTATLQANGKVLVTGGTGSTDLASAELYDSAEGSWGATGRLATGRLYHTSTLLPSGRVLIAGAPIHNGPLAEIYDPVSQTW